MKRQLNLKKKNHFKKMNVVAIFFFFGLFVCFCYSLFQKLAAREKFKKEMAIKTIDWISYVATWFLLHFVCSVAELTLVFSLGVSRIAQIIRENTRVNLLICLFVCVCVCVCVLDYRTLGFSKLLLLLSVVFLILSEMVSVVNNVD